MVEFVWDCITHRENGVLLAPRGSAKTTWDDSIFLSWLLAMFPDIRIGLISNTASQAKDFSRAIKWTYESNQAHIALFGNCMSNSKWTDVEWLRAGSKWHGSKDVSLFAQGAGGAIISKRFDIILCDDILDEENTATVDQRESVDNWFWKTLRPCLTPDGVIIVIGTRWAEDDLYERLITSKAEGGKGWRHLIIPALQTQPDGEMRSYWEEVWPVDRLLEEREQMGSAIFSCAYQNDISGLLAGNIFRGPFEHFDVLPEGHLYTTKMGVDLASSEKERADFTARVTTAKDRCPKDCPQSGDFYVLSAVRDKRETHHAEFVHDGWLAYPAIDLVIVESQQFQSTLIHTVMSDYPQIPIEGKRADVDKTTRARAVAARYEAHKVRHHRSLRGSAFETELLSFPKGHDDFVDSLGYSMDLGGEGFVFGSVRK